MTLSEYNIIGRHVHNLTYFRLPNNTIATVGRKCTGMKETMTNDNLGCNLEYQNRGGTNKKGTKKYCTLKKSMKSQGRVKPVVSMFFFPRPSPSLPLFLCCKKKYSYFYIMADGHGNNPIKTICQCT